MIVCDSMSSLEEATTTATSDTDCRSSASTAAAANTAGWPADETRGMTDSFESKGATSSVCSSSIRTVSPGDSQLSSSSAHHLQPQQGAELSPKPFFIMDFLEQVNSDDLALAQQMLGAAPKKAPRERKVSVDTASTEDSHSPKQLFGRRSPTDCVTANTPRVSEPQLQQQQEEESDPQACFRRRSIALGNRWNAKGLRKAQAGNWKAACTCWENALEIRLQVLGEYHLDTANSANNLGIALGKLGRFEPAIAALQRALDIRTRTFGLEHPEVAATIFNIGNVMQQAGDLRSAVDCFSECRRLQEKLLGPDDVQVARACVSAGSTYCQAGEYESARTVFTDALSIFDRAGLAKDNVEVQHVMAQVQELDQIVSQKQNGTCP